MILLVYLMIIFVKSVLTIDQKKLALLSQYFILNIPTRQVKDNIIYAYIHFNKWFLHKKEPSIDFETVHLTSIFLQILFLESI